MLFCYTVEIGSRQDHFETLCFHGKSVFNTCQKYVDPMLVFAKSLTVRGKNKDNHLIQSLKL